MLFFYIFKQENKAMFCKKFIWQSHARQNTLMPINHIFFQVLMTKQSDVLQKVKLTIKSKTECNDAYKPYFILKL